MATKAELNWKMNYKAVKAIVLKYNRFPSRHIPEDSKLLNWLKYNRRKRNNGTLDPKKAELLAELHELRHRIANEGH